MFTHEEKQTLDKIKQIDNIESRFNNLLEKTKANVRHPQEIFDEYVRQEKSRLKQQEKNLKESGKITRISLAC
jgi:hypothetical protein